MPRISRAKSVKRHGSAVQLPSKRAFAVDDVHVTESIVPGLEPQQAFATEATEPSLSTAVASSSRLRKADRPPAAALAPLPLHPYSRSHVRREKRKARQQLQGGELHTIAAALSESIGEPVVKARTKSKAEIEEERAARRAKKVENGKIGEGKGRTLTENARRQQITLEAKRIPAVMAHPQFKQNPWATIRLHASNSLSAKDGPATGEKGKSTKSKKGDRMEGVE